MGSPVSGSSGPQKTEWGTNPLNSIKKGGEKILDVALIALSYLPVVGKYASDYRAKLFIARLPDNMNPDQVELDEVISRLASETPPLGVPSNITQEKERLPELAKRSPSPPIVPKSSPNISAKSELLTPGDIKNRLRDLNEKLNRLEEDREETGRDISEEKAAILSRIDRYETLLKEAPPELNSENKKDISS